MPEATPPEGWSVLAPNVIVGAAETGERPAGSEGASGAWLSTSTFVTASRSRVAGDVRDERLDLVEPSGTPVVLNETP